MDKIIIDSLKIFAYHGVNPEETVMGQWFVLDIEALAEKIRQLTNAKNKLDADYESAQKQEKSTYESSLKVIPMNAGKKFVLPKDPRK